MNPPAPSEDTPGSEIEAKAVAAMAASTALPPASAMAAPAAAASAEGAATATRPMLPRLPRPDFCDRLLDHVMGHLLGDDLDPAAPAFGPLPEPALGAARHPHPAARFEISSFSFPHPGPQQMVLYWFSVLTAIAETSTPITHSAREASKGYNPGPTASSKTSVLRIRLLRPAGSQLVRSATLMASLWARHSLCGAASQNLRTTSSQ